MDELALAKRLIAFDTSNAEGLRRAAEFVGGWLESNDIEAVQSESRGLPVTKAEVGPSEAPTLVLHGSSLRNVIFTNSAPSGGKTLGPPIFEAKRPAAA